jgi:hypothetical protein
MRHGESRISMTLMDNFIGCSLCVNNPMLRVFVGNHLWYVSVSMSPFVLEDGCNGKSHSIFVTNNIPLLLELKVEGYKHVNLCI